jgi:hypothetical protein
MVKKLYICIALVDFSFSGKILKRESGENPELFPQL